jgi:hypothetical protein
MQIRRLAPIGLALAASATVFASIAHGSLSPRPAQETQLDFACGTTADSVDKALANASSAQVQTIQSKLVVVTPGKLTGRIAFNRQGKIITVAAEPASTAGTATTPTTHSGFGCSQGRAGRHGLGPGQSRQVSTLTETFTKAGTYTLTFRLNQVGRGLLAQLAAAERAYAKNHPHGHQPPSMAFGVALSYESDG